MSGQKSTACLEDISVWDFYYSVPALYLQWSIIFIFCLLAPEGMNSIVFGKEPEGYDLFWYCLRDAVNADKIISSAIIVYDKFTTILWQYIIFLFWMVYLSNKQYNRLRSVSMMRTSILNTATTEQMGYDIVSFFRLFSPNKSDDTSFEQAVVFWFLPHLPPKDYCIHSFWCQNTEKRNNTISQMRLRSVLKMRISILNTATTEHLGYGIISFFVCFL